MTTPLFRRLTRTTLIALFALALPAFLSAQTSPAPVSTNAKKHHTITITYASGTWSYTIHPAQPDPKKAKVKRGDTVSWVCADGSWEVFFKDGVTPLVDAQGNPVSTVDGGSGATNGYPIGAKAKDGDSYTYGVRVNLNGGGTVVDDPEIIIDSDLR